MLLVQKLVNPLGNSSRYLRWNSVCLAVSTSTRKLHLSRPNESAFGEDAKNALRNFGDIKHAPIPALTYGIGGLIPFTAIPVYMLSSGVYIPEMAFTSMAYSAVILSFIGGVRWGSAVSNPEVSSQKILLFHQLIFSFLLQIMNPNWKNFTTSIAPSIVGWMSLLVSNPIGTLLSISGFSLCLLQDMTSSQFPSWYKSLRILLSTVAICALLTTFMCQFLLPLEPQKE